MTQPAHTPTPWLYAPTSSTMQGYSQPYAISQIAERNLIAGCFGDVRGGIDTAQANASFIVKAVNCHEDLVAALRDTLNMLRAAHMDSGTQHDTNKRVIKARAALAKAEAA